MCARWVPPLARTTSLTFSPVFRFPAWRWCIKSNLPALTVIVRGSAPVLPLLAPLSASALAALSTPVTCLLRCHLSPVYGGQLNVHCLLPRRIPVVLSSLRPLTQQLSSHGRRTRTRRPHSGHTALFSFQATGYITTSWRCWMLPPSLTRRETCGENVKSFARQNYKLSIWAY